MPHPQSNNPHQGQHGIKHYGEYPGALFLDAGSLSDNDLIYVATHPGFGGPNCLADILTKASQDTAYHARYNTLFQGVQPSVPAGYVAPANVEAACAKYAEFVAQKHG